MLKVNRIFAITVLTFSCTTVNAFSLGDIVGAGLNAGGKLIGAAVDKVTESKPDPEKQAKEQAEQDRQMQAQLDKIRDDIEARPDLRPIDRERLILATRDMYAKSKEFAAFIERSDAQKRAERDKLFTAGGVAGVVGGAAANQVQSHMVVNQAMYAANHPTAYKNMQQADSVRGTATTLAAISKTSDILSQSGVQPESAVVAASQNGSAPTAGDAFAPDLGKKIAIEFEDSPEQTAYLRRWLIEHGHTLSENKTDADVTYLVQGEYAVQETEVYTGSVTSLGKLLDTPSMVIALPEKKTLGSIKRGVATFFTVVAGQQVPPAAISNAHKQKVLLVVARQPRDGKETRVSVQNLTDSEQLEYSLLAKKTLADMQALLGIQTQP